MELIQNTEVASRSLFSTERCPSRFMGGVKYVQIVESKKVERDAPRSILGGFVRCVPGPHAALRACTRARALHSTPLLSGTRTSLARARQYWPPHHLTADPSPATGDIVSIPATTLAMADKMN